MSKKITNIAAVMWVVFSFAFVIILMKTGHVNFETNDDVIMAQITAGVFKKYSAYNVFSNIVLGLFLAGFTKVAPGINWPTMLDLGFIAISYAMLGVVCIKASRKVNLISALLPLTFIMSTFNTLILGINFSKVGAIMFFTGFLVILFSLDNRTGDEGQEISDNRFLRIIGYIMFVAGSLVRFDSVKAMAPFAAILVIYFCIKSRNISKIIRLIAPCIVVALLWIVNFFVYNTPEWKVYNRYEKVCVDMQDFYGFPDYEKHIEEYEALGLNEHDAIMFACYIHADDEVFSLETIESLRDMAREDFKKTIDYEYIKQIAKSVFYLAGSQTIILVVIMVFAVTAFAIPIKYLPYSGAAVLLMIAELAYLYHINRVLERSLVLPVIGAFLTLIYLLVCNTQESNQVAWPAAVVMICIAVYAFFTRGMCEIRNLPVYITPDKENLEDLNLELQSQPENLYIWDYQSYADASQQYASPLDEYPANFMGNSLVLGAWPVEMPLMREIASPFGDPGNLMRILTENPNAYYVFENNNPYMTVEAMEQYIRDHYNPTASFSKVEAVGGYTIYSVE